MILLLVHNNKHKAMERVTEEQTAPKMECFGVSRTYANLFLLYDCIDCVVLLRRLFLFCSNTVFDVR